MSGERDQGGAVLALVLLLLLALMLVGNGVLFLARRELETARASVNDLRGRLAAEGAVRSLTESWPAASADGLAVGESTLLGELALGQGLVGEVTLRRLGPELFLVEGVSRQEAWPGVARAARLVWVSDAGTRVRSFDAVAQVGGDVVLDPLSRLEGSVGTSEPEGWDSVCEPLSADLGALYSDGTLPLLRALDTAGRTPGALLGPFSAEELEGFASHLVGGAVTPSPSTRAGVCAEEVATNWGDPDDPGSPCGGFLPLIVATDSLVVRGGEGQGILVVGGSLRLEAGARFAGPVMVAGDLTLTSDARIEGLVTVLGRLELQRGARIVGSGCAALRAMGAAEIAAHATPIPIRSWISPY